MTGTNSQFSGCESIYYSTSYCGFTKNEINLACQNFWSQWFCTWRYRGADLLGSRVDVAHEGHPLDEELAEAKERCAQPRRHEHADEEDEGDRGDKPKTCQKEYDEAGHHQLQGGNY